MVAVLEVEIGETEPETGRDLTHLVLDVADQGWVVVVAVIEVDEEPEL